MEDREQLRKEILEELKKEFYLKPKVERLEVGDILDKYKSQLLSKTNQHFSHNGYSQMEAIKQAIRKCVCLHFDVYSLKDIPKEWYNDYREEVERFIIEYLNCEKEED